jgi:hypothetical protein
LKQRSLQSRDSCWRLPVPPRLPCLHGHRTGGSMRGCSSYSAAADTRTHTVKTPGYRRTHTVTGMGGKCQLSPPTSPSGPRTDARIRGVSGRFPHRHRRCAVNHRRSRSHGGVGKSGGRQHPAGALQVGHEEAEGPTQLLRVAQHNGRHHHVQQGGRVHLVIPACPAHTHTRARGRGHTHVRHVHTHARACG